MCTLALCFVVIGGGLGCVVSATMPATHWPGAWPAGTCTVKGTCSCVPAGELQRSESASVTQVPCFFGALLVS